MKFSLILTALLSIQATRLHQKQPAAADAPAEVPAAVQAEPAADKENEIKAAVASG